MATKEQNRNDLILLLVCLAVASVFFLFTRLTRSEGGYAVVYVDGQETARYPLSQEVDTVLAGKGGTNRLVIRNGIAEITEADCPDALCVRQHPIQYKNETIVCLPHRLVVQIEGDAPEGADLKVG